MSISSQIDRITQAVADSYSKAEAKGATMPASAVIANLPATIESIVGNIGAFENLFVPDLGTETQVGITCTDNGDGSYTLNGTATGGTARFVFGQKFTNGVTYKLCGGAEGSSRSGYMLYIRHNVANIVDEGNGVTFTADSDIVYLAINVNSGVTCNNVVFRPIITTNLNVTKDNWYPKIKSVENIFVPTLETQTLNGVTVTNNGDGTYTLNGTATARTDFSIATNTKMIQFYNSLGGKTVRFVGCPAGGNDSTYRINSYISGSKVVNVFEYGNGRTIELPTNVASANFVITIQSGYTCNNIVFKPMITTNLSATYDNFVKRVGGFNNLFVPTLATTTLNGVTCTNNGDGTYTLNGTCTANNTDFTLATNMVIGSTVKLVGTPKQEIYDNVRLFAYNGSVYYTDKGDGAIIPPTTLTYVRIRVDSGVTLVNRVFKPMVTESLLPEYYDFVKGIEGKKFAVGTLANSATGYITIPHNLGIVPKWFAVFVTDTGNYTNFTHGAIYNNSVSSNVYVQYQGRLATKAVSTTKDSTSTAYIGTDVITVPQYSSSYYWLAGGRTYIWMCGE